MPITSNVLWKSVDYTLDKIYTEDLSPTMVALGKGKIVAPEPMRKALIRDTEVAGLTLFPEKVEGDAMAQEEVIMGGISEYLPKTFAKCVPITEEALEDEDTDKIVNSTKRLRAAAYKTRDIDAANLLLTCLTRVGGFDKAVLASTTHSLPSGGTASNYLNSGSGMTPSTQALQMMRNMAALMPGPNGLVDGVELRAVTFPDVQLDLWKIITQTGNAVGNNFNDINTVKSYNLDLVPVKWFDAVSTDFWGCLTNAEDGLRYLDRRALKGTTWVDNNCMVAYSGYSYRSVCGHSNWRAFILGYPPS